uniref:Reverse transcriptase/retrotransposon-derived protein RNase H-like domain-containing protein n=1 Tax=Chelonoidis abingdonii TaxID=106734 RepID=A0A8C0GQC8_CHEAB
MEKAFRELKKALVQPPALALPDPRKPFTLYVHERGGVAAGVLCQKAGPTWQPIGYYSKVLDPVAKGWPACLRAVAATALLVQEAEKLTLGATEYNIQKRVNFTNDAIAAVKIQKMRPLGDVGEKKHPLPFQHFCAGVG